MLKGLRSVRISFTARTLTHFGGVFLRHRFCGPPGLRKAHTKHVRLAQRNTRYSVGAMMKAISRLKL